LSGRASGSLPGVANHPHPRRPEHLSFDEYRLYYESAERVTDRRLDLNKWNYSIMVATLLAIGAVLAWATSRADHEFVGILGVLILAVMACLHCTFWLRQIDDFKALNSEKFRVLNEMAPYVRFRHTGPGITVRSYEPFRREWEAMAAEHAIGEIHRSTIGRIVALRSSTAEYFMARVFRLVFALTVVGTLALIVVDHASILGHISPFPATHSPTP